MRHTPPEYVDVTPEMRARLEQFQEDHRDDPLGDVANRVLWEDDVLRIWEMKLEPGEHSDLHHHSHDYYLVIFSGDQVAGVSPKGSGIESFVGRVPPGGNTVAIPKGRTEWAWNVGNETYHEILIELKNT